MMASQARQAAATKQSSPPRLLGRAKSKSGRYPTDSTWSTAAPKSPSLGSIAAPVGKAAAALSCPVGGGASAAWAGDLSAANWYVPLLPGTCPAVAHGSQNSPPIDAQACSKAISLAAATSGPTTPRTPRVQRTCSTPPPAPKIATAAPLLAALKRDSVAGVRAVLAADASAASAPFLDNGLEPPLCCAARLRCSPDIVKLLLEHGADVNAPDMEGATPLRLLRMRHTSKPRFLELENVLVSAGAVDEGAEVSAAPTFDASFRYLRELPWSEEPRRWRGNGSWAADGAGWMASGAHSGHGLREVTLGELARMPEAQELFSLLHVVPSRSREYDF
eukprot:TRINITY_DN16785_c0_g1_i1.p1 TRINITY_DN16785_c0_g1~~TRINITY_DN16785_c0_g1_i1.p1  ORF type:complete len:334 (-),score=55.90 TRINITY_DN16785_c0_g1_i1:82-1083(-)